MNQAMTVAISRIVDREPFYSPMILGLDIVEDPTQPTFCTDGKVIRYNPDFCATLSDKERIFVNLHEVEHVARLHPWRREQRDPVLWNIACDYVVNYDLTRYGYTMPKGGLLDHRFNGKAEEEVYSILHKEQQQQQQQQSQSGQQGQGQGQGQGQSGQNQQQQQSGQGTGQGKSGKGKAKAGQAQGQGRVPGDVCGQFTDCPGTEAEVQEALDRIKVEILRAAEIAKSEGKLPASMESMIESIKHPKVPWQDVLRDYLTAYARDDYSWMRPNPRYADTGFCMPSLRSEHCGTIAVVIDTSGSIGQNEFDQFIGELREIISTMKPVKTILIQCDSDVEDYRIFESSDELDDKVKLCGGGGTSFIPPFTKLEEEGETPDVLVYLTDAYGQFGKEPDYPVVWVVTTDQSVPWGQRVDLRTNN